MTPHTVQLSFFSPSCSTTKSQITPKSSERKDRFWTHKSPLSTQLQKGESLSKSGAGAAPKLSDHSPGCKSASVCLTPLKSISRVAIDHKSNAKKESAEFANDNITNSRNGSVLRSSRITKMLADYKLRRLKKKLDPLPGIDDDEVDPIMAKVLPVDRGPRLVQGELKTCRVSDNSVNKRKLSRDLIPSYFDQVSNYNHSSTHKNVVSRCVSNVQTMSNSVVNIKTKKRLNGNQLSHMGRSSHDTSEAQKQQDVCGSMATKKRLSTKTFLGNKNDTYTTLTIEKTKVAEGVSKINKQHSQQDYKKIIRQFNDTLPKAQSKLKSSGVLSELTTTQNHPSEIKDLKYLNPKVSKMTPCPRSVVQSKLMSKSPLLNSIKNQTTLNKKKSTGEVNKTLSIKTDLCQNNRSNQYPIVSSESTVYNTLKKNVDTKLPNKVREKSLLKDTSYSSCFPSQRKVVKMNHVSNIPTGSRVPITSNATHSTTVNNVSPLRSSMSHNSHIPVQHPISSTLPEISDIPNNLSSGSDITTYPPIHTTHTGCLPTCSMIIKHSLSQFDVPKPINDSSIQCPNIALLAEHSDVCHYESVDDTFMSPVRMSNKHSVSGVPVDSLSVVSSKNNVSMNTNVLKKNMNILLDPLPISSSERMGQPYYPDAYVDDLSISLSDYNETPSQILLSHTTKRIIESTVSTRDTEETSQLKSAHLSTTLETEDLIKKSSLLRDYTVETNYSGIPTKESLGGESSHIDSLESECATINDEQDNDILHLLEVPLNKYDDHVIPIPIDDQFSSSTDDCQIKQSVRHNPLVYTQHQLTHDPYLVNLQSTPYKKHQITPHHFIQHPVYPKELRVSYDFKKNETNQHQNRLDNDIYHYTTNLQPSHMLVPLHSTHSNHIIHHKTHHDVNELFDKKNDYNCRVSNPNGLPVLGRILQSLVGIAKGHVLPSFKTNTKLQMKPTELLDQTTQHCLHTGQSINQTCAPLIQLNNHHYTELQSRQFITENSIMNKLTSPVKLCKDYTQESNPTIIANKNNTDLSPSTHIQNLMTYPIRIPNGQQDSCYYLKQQHIIDANSISHNTIVPPCLENKHVSDNSTQPTQQFDNKHNIPISILLDSMDPMYTANSELHHLFPPINQHKQTDSINNSTLGKEDQMDDSLPHYTTESHVNPVDFQQFTQLLVTHRQHNDSGPSCVSTQTQSTQESITINETLNHEADNFLHDDIPPRHLSAISSPENTLIIWDWDDTILPTYHLAVEHRCTLTDHMIPLKLKEQLQELEDKVLRSLRISMRNGCTILVTNASFRWLTDSALKYFPKLWEFIKKYKIKILSARDICQPLGLPQSDWKRLLVRDQVERFFEHLDLPYTLIKQVSHIISDLKYRDSDIFKLFNLSQPDTQSNYPKCTTNNQQLNDLLFFMNPHISEQIKIDHFSRVVALFLNIHPRIIAMTGLLVTKHDIQTESFRKDTALVNETNYLLHLVPHYSDTTPHNTEKDKKTIQTELNPLNSKISSSTNHLINNVCSQKNEFNEDHTNHIYLNSTKTSTHLNVNLQHQDPVPCFPYTVSSLCSSITDSTLYGIDCQPLFPMIEDTLEHRIIHKYTEELLARHRYLPGVGLLSENFTNGLPSSYSCNTNHHHPIKPNIIPTVSPDILNTISSITSVSISAHTESLKQTLNTSHQPLTSYTLQQQKEPIDYSSAVLQMLTGNTHHSLVIPSIPEGRLELPTATITTSFPYIILPEGNILHIRDLFPPVPSQLGLKETPCSVLSIGDGQGEREAVMAAMAHWDTNYRETVKLLTSIRDDIYSLFCRFLSHCEEIYNQELVKNTSLNQLFIKTTPSISTMKIIQAPTPSWTFKSLKLSSHPTVGELSNTHDALQLALLVCLDVEHSLDATINTIQKDSVIDMTSCKLPTLKESNQYNTYCHTVEKNINILPHINLTSLNTPIISPMYNSISLNPTLIHSFNSKGNHSHLLSKTNTIPNLSSSSSALTTHSNKSPLHTPLSHITQSEWAAPSSSVKCATNCVNSIRHNNLVGSSSMNFPSVFSDSLVPAVTS